MSALNEPEVVVYEVSTPEDIDAAMSELAGRCNDLPPKKQAFLIQAIESNPGLEIETMSLLVLLLENSDDEYNITTPAVKQMLADAHVDLENL